MKSAFLAVSFACAFAAAPALPAILENDVEHNARRQQELAAFNPRYAEAKAERVALLRSLAKKVEQREAAKESTACSHQILFELKMLIYFTADFDAVDKRIRDLQAVLAHPDREASAGKPDPVDGSWRGLL